MSRGVGAVKRDRLKICWLSAYTGSNPVPCSDIMPIKIKCFECGKEAEVKNPKTKFCGPACYREAMRKLNRARSRDKEYRKKKMYPATKRWLMKKR